MTAPAKAVTRTATYTAAQYNTHTRDNFTAIWVYTTAGDIAYATSATTLARLGIGSVGQIVYSTGSAPVWGPGERYIPMYLNNDVALITGDYQGWFAVPSAFNGWNVTSVLAMRQSGTGVPEFQLRRIRSGASVDMLSTKCTIDSGETTSGTAATPAVINTSNDDLATNDILVTDVDVAGTSTYKAVMMAGVSRP